MGYKGRQNIDKSIIFNQKDDLWSLKQPIQETWKCVIDGYIHIDAMRIKCTAGKSNKNSHGSGGEGPTQVVR